MLVLAIDTAGPECSCCLYDGIAGVEIVRKVDAIGRGHAEHLMGQIEDLMTQAQCDVSDIGRIGVAIGPGSFTGIRVGVAAARGLALALGITAVGISTLEALASDHIRAANGQAVMVALAAGRDQFFVQLFKSDGRPVGDPALAGIEQSARQMGDNISICIGDGARAIQNAVKRPIKTLADDRKTGDIATIARLALNGQHPPSPLYIRGADAKKQDGFAIARAKTGDAV